MIEKFQMYFNLVTIILIFFCLPGILLIINGIRTINNKKAVTIGRDSHFRWRKTMISIGNQALEIGKLRIIFGVIFFVTGICLVSIIMLQ
jgi:hypothetical protein